ncbi:MAG: tRNA pseudouridine(55) synthase TruB [Firmicutes bacterium]|nr:tRNA pseudouridine(55) synthase TruB [Bacillota bacterium]
MTRSEASHGPELSPGSSEGILNLLKPPGLTSHDTVDILRRIFGIRRIGHAGTLDPCASGVLPVCIGRATRIMPYLLDSDKEYRAEMTLGIETDTYDSEGATTRVEVDFEVSRSRVDEVLARYLGPISQVPPMTSAVRVGGRRLYDLAREGKTVERPPRRVEIYDLQVVTVWPHESETCGFGARILFNVVCSKGTYIRSLCSSIGADLGCGAHMSFLVRTRAGPFKLFDSVSFDELQKAGSEGRMGEYLLSLDAGLSHLPAVTVDEDDSRKVVHGGWVGRPSVVSAPSGLAEGDLVRIQSESRKLLCVARAATEAEGFRFKPLRVLV